MKLTKKRILIGFLLAFCAFFLWVMPPIPRAFDSKEWATCKDHSVRISMVQDLQKKYKLVGMTREQVFKLLGKPEGSMTTSTATYDMGATAATDDNFFYVNFDGDKVVSVEDYER